MSLRDYLIYIKDTPIRHTCWMCFGTGKVNKKDCKNDFCLKTLEDELAAEAADEEES